MLRSLALFTATALLLTACAQNKPSTIASGTFEPSTSVYDCVARERPFSIVTQTAPSGLTIFIPEPFVPRTLLLNRVEAASGERYESEGVTAWTKGDDAVFIVDTVSITKCDLNRQAISWEAAKLDGVDFRAIGNTPTWVLEIRDREALTLRYDDAVVEVIVATVTRNQDDKTAVFAATSASGDLRVTLSGKVCTDSASGDVYRTSVLIEHDGANYSGCGRALH